MIPSNVYELLPIINAPGVQCFGIEDRTSLTGGTSLLNDFLPRDVSKRPWHMHSMMGSWSPRRVINPLAGQVNDYPCIGLTIPTFSRRAVDALRDLLEPNGELLPLDSDEGSNAYFAFNTTTVADVLDRERSDIEWFPIDRLRIKKGVPIDLINARKIRHYEFRVDDLQVLSIFRLIERFTDIYVTETFAERVRAHNLKGFNLRKVFPCPRPAAAV